MISNPRKFSRLFWLPAYLLVATPTSVSAQVIPDTTLPNNSVAPSNGQTIEITGGTPKQSNLFHSFEQFSLATGSTALFKNASAFENIISRVTGKSISNIDGRIQVEGNANLFLINPNGIIFGPNATLDIRGSFIGSTANSIKFADDNEFSAVNPQASPLLTISVPVGLQYGDPGNITVQGLGNNLFLNSPTDPSVNRSDRPPGLQVDTGQTLALVGGNLTLEGGNLTTAGGRIELGSVGVGMVTLTPTNPGWMLGYDNIERFQDIQLSQAASLEASGNSGGSIQVQGRNVKLTDASAILADTLGSGSGGMLTVKATDTVQVSGFSFPPSAPPFMSRLSTDVAPEATGDGGNLIIETGRLLITDGAQISTGTFSAGNAGTLRVTAKELEIIGGSPIGASGLFAPVEADATGNGGNLTIKTDRLQISNGAQIAVSTFGSGNAGALNIQANQVELIGISPEGSPSGLFATVESGATGNGGNLLIESDRLQLTNGAQLAVSTFSDGNAGTLTVRTQNLEAIGGAPRGSSGLFAVSRATGNGGNLLIETNSLRLVDGGQIATATGGSGNAGDLIVKALESVELIGTTELGRSGLFSSAINGTGEGGNLTVSTGKLIVRDEATISVSNFSSRNPNIPPGQGAAGNLNVDANLILLDNQGILTAEAAAGDRGNINLQSDTIFLRRDSAITTNAQDTATGGNITLNTDILGAFENSDITANAKQSFGGRVIINAQGVFGAQFRGQLTPESDVTASSNLGAQFNGVVQLNTPDINPNQALVKLPSDLVDRSTQVVAVCQKTGGNEFVITGRGGLPEVPAQILRDGTVWEDLRLAWRGNQELEAKNQNSPTPKTRHPTRSQVPIIEARGWVMDANGQVTLVSHLPQTPSQSWYASSQCGSVK
ncbi:S-layer family protein [Komarekiella sp. 'clone 1']|uniref:S-layer family protein n=1 Tax=Komarekiella delphini-convector SJRDD-AB1 TaxID=2593771 RepID=A0AA40SUX0_9NOST|nr:S-layer family protein [Komarekiella delphini-convector]MBD6615504.1 S-layer family protein [Komarekiella delphini-convector SJRDD-AB1]